MLLKQESNRVKELRRENSELRDKVERLAAQVARLKKLIGSKGGANTSDLLAEIDRLENKLKFAEAEIKRLNLKSSGCKILLMARVGKISRGVAFHLVKCNIWQTSIDQIQYRFITDGSDSVVKAKKMKYLALKN